MTTVLPLWNTIASPQDIRLIVADMDGTLLDADGQIPEGFWPLLDTLNQRGITFVPASGRQYHTLQGMFAQANQSMSYIAENGAVVVLDGQVVEAHELGHDIITQVIDMVDTTSSDLGLVVCGVNSAYVQRTDDAFIAQASKYYAKITPVPNLRDVLDDPNETVVKLAIFDFDDAETMAQRELGFVREPYEYVCSSKHWVDIMDTHVDKGEGVKTLQQHLGVSKAQTAAFGDYPNDNGMLDEAEFSFAMANAHADTKQHAHYEAPANTQEGVLRVIERLIG